MKKQYFTFNAIEYAQHLLGIQALLLWIECWKELSPVSEQDGIFRCPNLVSQRFGLGLPSSRRFGQWPFLALQKEESDIFKLLSLNRVVVLLEHSYLILVTNRVPGNNEDLSDVPAFGFAINVDDVSKIDLKVNKMNIRGIWFDDEGLHVERQSFAELPFKKAILWETVLDKSELQTERSVQDWVKSKIRDGNRLVNPGYMGQEVPVSEEFRKLVEPFDPSKVPAVRE